MKTRYKEKNPAILLDRAYLAKRSGVAERF
jgi:hypothetical protein